MSYKIKQIISSNNDLNNYSTVISSNLNFAIVENKTTEKKYMGIRFNSNDSNFTLNERYYVKIIINNVNNNNVVDICTSNNGGDVFLVQTSNNEYTSYSVMQTILPSITFYKQGNTVIEFIFTPNSSSYNTIVFTEFKSDSGDVGVNSSLVTKSLEVRTLTNLLTGANITKAKKFGIQGPPGLLFCINKEGLRIGPNGFYEIKNDYLIDWLSVMRKDNNQKFMIDLLYE